MLLFGLLLKLLAWSVFSLAGLGLIFWAARWFPRQRWLPASLFALFIVLAVMARFNKWAIVLIVLLLVVARGVLDVVITPDTHHGYVVPVGCVIATSGTLLQAACGYDIGCFTADTLVPLVDGKSYPIGELAEAGKQIFVYALSPEQRIVIAA